MRPHLGTCLIASVLAACSADPESTTVPRCGAAGPTVLTDIDATLTIDDLEIVKQLSTGTHEPIGREGGAELLRGYAERGYFVIYATGRSEEMTLAGTGETARDATMRWLRDGGYPVERATLYLAPTNAEAGGEPARVYKAARFREAASAGFEFRYAYGNAQSDIDAYADVAVPKEATFIIGPEAGKSGTVAVSGEGWTEHAAQHLPDVPAVCEP
jgi:phosphatidate phosphatase PAH1